MKKTPDPLTNDSDPLSEDARRDSNIAIDEAQALTSPVIDRRQAYRINRMRIIDTSLDEGDKLHALGCIKRGGSTTHFIFTAKNNGQTRHDLHVVSEGSQASNIWGALLCSCPTGRHPGDPCWHKGAVRAFLADNQHIRYANKLLALPLI